MNKVDFKADKEAILNAVGRLIAKRKTLAPFDPEHYEINGKLDKLYYHYRIILEQENN